MINWLRPSKRSASVFFPPGVSKEYGFSIFTHGSSRRFALNASLARVSSFSCVSNSLRAASHSAFDTTRGWSVLLDSNPALLVAIAVSFDGYRTFLRANFQPEYL